MLGSVCVGWPAVLTPLWMHVIIAHLQRRARVGLATAELSVQSLRKAVELWGCDSRADVAAVHGCVRLPACTAALVHGHARHDGCTTCSRSLVLRCPSWTDARPCCHAVLIRRSCGTTVATVCYKVLPTTASSTPPVVHATARRRLNKGWYPTAVNALLARKRGIAALTEQHGAAGWVLTALRSLSTLWRAVDIAVHASVDTLTCCQWQMTRTTNYGRSVG